MPTRILLVEDNPGDAVIFREKLDASDLEYELVHAKRLEDGLSQLGNAHFDIMMVDLSLPDAHGMEAVIKVREAAPTHPLIVLTGLDDATAAAEAKQQGAVDYLVKWYVDSTSLARYIRYAIAQYEMIGRDESEAPSSSPDETMEVEGTVVSSPKNDEDEVSTEVENDPLRQALQASAAALLIVSEEDEVVFANQRARQWVQGESYPWTLSDGIERIPRKGQALEQHASQTTWNGEPAWFVVLRPARPEPAPQPAAAKAPPVPAPEPPVVHDTTLRAASAALAFAEQSQRQSAWLADVLRSALDAERDLEVQADLIDVLGLLNQVVREQRDLAMQRGLPLRVTSERKKVMAYADRNLVNQILQRLVVDAIQEARHDGIHLRADVEGDTSVVEAHWHQDKGMENENGHAALGRRLVERFTQQAGGTCDHDVDVTGRRTFTVRLPGTPEA